MEKKKLVTIVIPLYNEVNRFPKLFEKSYPKLKSYFDNLELILVNDGSTDNTLEYLNNLSKRHQKINIISYLKNQGKGYALKQGVIAARGEIIGFMDADFAISLEETPKFINKINQGFDLVIGDRHSTDSNALKKPELKRLILGKILGILNNLFLNLGRIKDTQCGFKFFKKPAAKQLFSDLKINRWLFDLEILLKALEKGYKICQLPVTWEGVEDSKVSISNDLQGVIKDLSIIYLRFYKQSLKTSFQVYKQSLKTSFQAKLSNFGYNLKIHLALSSFLLLVILAPFLITPENLVRRNGDYSDLVWPNYIFLKESFNKYHQLPLWNPTVFSGIPEIANPQSPLIYPVNYIVLIFPVDLTIIILIFLHALVASTFVYLTSKRVFNFSTLISTIISLSFTFSPFIWGKVAVGHLSQSFAILLLGPIFYSSGLFFKKFTIKRLLLFSSLLSIQYLNYPTLWYYTCLFGLVFITYICFIQRQFKRLISYFIASVLSILIISPIFLVQYLTGQMITRTSLSLSELSIPLWSLKRFITSVVIPANLTHDLETETWLYPGLSLLIISFLGFFRAKLKLKAVVFFLLASVILITLGNRTFVFGLLTDILPGFSYLRVSTRDWFVLIIIVTFLSGYFLNFISNFKLKILLGLVILIDCFSFSLLRLWEVPKIMEYSPNTDIMKLLVKDDFRYYCTSRCLSARETMPLRINTADGYHILILNHYRQTLSQAGGFPPPKYTGNIPSIEDNLAQPNAKLLGELSVKWVISEYEIDDTNFSKVKTSGKYSLYKNNLVLNRIRFEKVKLNQAHILYESPNYIEIETDVDAADNLVLADTYLPGWEVKIDGVNKNLEIYEGWGRKVFVPTGTRIIEFEYHPFKYILKNI